MEFLSPEQVDRVNTYPADKFINKVYQLLINPVWVHETSHKIKENETFTWPQTLCDMAHTLTYLNRINFPISISRTSLFQILGVLGGTFHF